MAGYADWMKELLTPVPDGRYKLTTFAADEVRGTVVATAEFHGTQIGEGGPHPSDGFDQGFRSVPCWLRSAQRT